MAPPLRRGHLKKRPDAVLNPDVLAERRPLPVRGRRRQLLLKQRPPKEVVQQVPRRDRHVRVAGPPRRKPGKLQAPELKEGHLVVARKPRRAVKRQKPFQLRLGRQLRK